MNIFLLPGMGADSSMYGYEFRKIDKIIFIDWPEYKNESSLTELAKRIIELYQIQEGDIAGGSSLGGMIAAEVSKHVKLKKIILVGSSLLPSNINPLLRRTGLYINILPVHFIQVIARKTAVFFKGRNRKLLDMFSKTDASFIKAMCRAVSEWTGCLVPQCEVCKIHGEKDKILFSQKDSTILKNAGHLIAMTHEIEVASFIRCNMK